MDGGEADALGVAVEVAACVVQECGERGEGEEGVDEDRRVEAEGVVQGCGDGFVEGLQRAEGCAGEGEGERHFCTERGTERDSGM